jgi:hypothetical protein
LPSNHLNQILTPFNLYLNLFKGLIVQFLWHLFEIIARELAFALFASEYGFYLIIVLIIHFLIMLLWIRTMEPNSRISKF